MRWVAGPDADAIALAAAELLLIQEAADRAVDDGGAVLVRSLPGGVVMSDLVLLELCAAGVEIPDVSHRRLGRDDGRAVYVLAGAEWNAAWEAAAAGQGEGR